MRYYKLVVLGSGGVGKSALSVQYVQNIFIESYDPTIEDSYRKACIIDKQNSIVEILDTAGTEQFTSIRDLYMKNGDGFLLVFSLISKSSVLDLYDIFDQIIKIKNTTQVPVLLAGNKADLAKDRKFNVEDIEELKAKMNQIEYIETSAKTGINVELAFNTLIKSINLLNPSVKKSSRKMCLLL